MKYCPFCGTKLQDMMVFCPVCGEKYREAEETKPAQEETAGVEEPAPIPPQEEAGPKSGEVLLFPRAAAEAFQGEETGTATAVEEPEEAAAGEGRAKEDGKKPHRLKWQAIAVAVAVIAILLFALTRFAAPSSGGVPKAVLQGRDSVVRIAAEYSDGFTFGSGFVVAKRGKDTFVATNAHVVEDLPYAISILFDGGEVEAQIYAMEEGRDLCILRCGAIDAKPLKLAQGTAGQGEAVYAIGFPSAADYLSDTLAYGSEEATITNGIVSAVRTATLVDFGPQVELLQINAAINSGNSGGPLFNEKGQVVGINTYNIQDSQGIFGAVSAKELRALMEAKGVRTGGGVDVWSVAIGVTAAGLCVLSAIIVLRRRRGRKTAAEEGAPEAERSAVQAEAAPPTARKKRVKRRRPLLRVCVVLLLLCVVTAGAVGGLYWSVERHLDNWEFSAANRLILGRDRVAAANPELIAYIDAGLLLESGEYVEAEKAFRQFEEQPYRDSDDLLSESMYQYALQLRDKGEWRDAVLKMTVVSDRGYKDAMEQVDQIAYQEANYTMYVEGDVYRGFQRFKALADKGYGPAQNDMEAVRDEVYHAACEAYAAGDYPEAQKFFSCVRKYCDTEKYCTLINAKISFGSINFTFEEYNKEVVEDLMKIFNFEDAAEVLLSRQGLAEEFLEGTWRSTSGNYYFQMRPNGNTNYNLPRFTYGDYYEIADSTFWLYKANTPGTKRALYTFSLWTPNCMEVYCHKDGSSYVLYRS